MRRILIALTVAASMGASAISLLAQQPDTFGRVSGVVTFRERMALPPTAVVEITLEDVTRADAPAEAIARVDLVDAVGSPVPFELRYALDDIDGSHRYAVRARIVDADTVLFASRGTSLVLTQGHNNTADVPMAFVAMPVERPAPPAGSAPLVPSRPAAIEMTGLPASFTGTLACGDCRGVRYELTLFADDSFFLRTSRLLRGSARPEPAVDAIGSWVRSSDRRLIVLETSRGVREMFAVVDQRTLRRLGEGAEAASKSAQSDLRRTTRLAIPDVRTSMVGVYRVDGTSAEFTECSTGQRWVVGETTGAAALRTAAQRTGRAGNAVYARVDGHVVPDAGGTMTVMIDRVGETPMGTRCVARFASAPLEKTSWRLTRLGEAAVPAAQGAAAAGLVFRDDTSSFGGNGGCNRLTGAYETNGEDIRLQGIGTMKACAAVTENETRFRAALVDTRSFRIVGRTLELFGAGRQPLARFEAVD